MRTFRFIHWEDPMPFPETRYRIAGNPQTKQWVQVYPDPEGEKFKQRVAGSYEDQLGYDPAEPGIPIRLDAILVFERPKGHFGSGRNADVIKPQHLGKRPGKGGGRKKGQARYGADEDNCLKLLQDALAEHAYVNDGDVVDGRARKFFVDQVDGVNRSCSIIFLTVLAPEDAHYALDGAVTAEQSALPLPENGVILPGKLSPERRKDEEAERVGGSGSRDADPGFPGL